MPTQWFAQSFAPPLAARAALIFLAVAAQTYAAEPAFEVASVKPNASGAMNWTFHYDPGRFTAENMPLRALIEAAYGIRDYQLSGAPGWIGSARYDIAAKADGKTTDEQRSLMLQALLEDRFQLKTHRETKEHSLYALTVAKAGIKLRESAADCTTGKCGGWSRNERTITGTKISVAQFVQALSDYLEIPVIDKTEFAGAFDVQLEWRPDNATVADAAGPSIFTALQEQLGLKLESRKGPIEMLVIDRVERPGEN